jgi:lysophospholipase L1-like esterase
MDPPAESTSAPATDRTSVTPLVQASRPKIVLWGDSLTQTSFEGWGGMLANRYQRRADVVNRGMSGYNSSWYLQLPEESHENVVLCTIWFGANDASLKEQNPHHYVSLEDYQQNLRTLVAKAKKLMHFQGQKQANILLITPPPVDHDQRLAFQKERYADKATGVLERTLENSGKYAEACVQVANELNLPCLNLWQAFQTDANWSRFLSDGLHFSAAGQAFVFDKLIHCLQEEFPDLQVQPDPITGQACNSGSMCPGLPAFGPYHDEIDETDPEEAMKSTFADLAKIELANSAGATDSPSTKKPKIKMDAP